MTDDEINTETSVEPAQVEPAAEPAPVPVEPALADEESDAPVELEVPADADDHDFNLATPDELVAYLKEWTRRELAMLQAGKSEETRREQNP